MAGRPAWPPFFDLDNVTLFVSQYCCFSVFVQSLAEADVFLIDTTCFECIPYRVVVDGVERLHEVSCRIPHLESPPMAILFNHSVSRKMVHRLVGAPEPSLIFGLSLITSGIKSAVQDRRKQFVLRWQSTNRAIVSDVFLVPFFVDDFYPYSPPCFWSTAFLL